MYSLNLMPGLPGVSISLQNLEECPTIKISRTARPRTKTSSFFESIPSLWGHPGAVSRSFGHTANKPYLNPFSGDPFGDN